VAEYDQAPGGTSVFAVPQGAFSGEYAPDF